MTDRITTDPNDVLAIPESDLPLMVLTDNELSFFSWAIKNHQKDIYNHFMWMIKPGELVSQDWIFHSVPLGKYLTGYHRLKFIRDICWTEPDKELIVTALENNLELSWYQRLYDPLQIVGHWLRLRWLQFPGRWRVCSDYADILRSIDSNYNLWHPKPTEVNLYTKGHKERYEVYLRFIPD